MTRHTLHLPQFTPVSLNVLLRGVRQRIRQKKGDRDLIALEAHLQQIPKTEGRRRVTMHVVLAKGQRALDDDNAWKSILDALVCCGLLRGDSPRWLQRGPLYWARALHGDHRETFVVLEDL